MMKLIMSTNPTIQSTVNNFERNDVAAALRQLGADGVVAGDGELGADRVEAPGRYRSAGVSRLPAGDGGNGGRVLTVGDDLSSRGVETSDNCDSHDDNKDSDCESETDTQSYRH